MKELIPLNEIIQGDCIELMQSLPDNCIDLIFADPPYNLQLNGELYRPNQTKVDAVNDDWDKFESMQAYDKFSEKWLKECYRILKDTGSIWVIGTYHNIFRIGYIMQNIGYWILNDIIWIKTNPMPNFQGTRFNNAHETLIWATKTKNSKYTFNYHSLKIMNDDLQMRSDWLIPICQGAERIRDANGNKAHSTQKPAELLYRIILATSNPNDIVFDPFMGTGTTGAVAKRLGRNYLGFEKEKKYVELARARIANTKQLPNNLITLREFNRKPKVSFGNLVEKGMVKIGEELYSKDLKYKAIVQADASIATEKEFGSIHKVSASLLQKEHNNGWTFWYVKRDDKLLCIDDLRYQYEEKFNTINKNWLQDYKIAAQIHE